MQIRLHRPGAFCCYDNNGASTGDASSCRHRHRFISITFFILFLLPSLQLHLSARFSAFFPLLPQLKRLDLLHNVVCFVTRCFLLLSG